MSFRYTRLVLLVSVALLSACGSGPEAAATSTSVPATATIIRTTEQPVLIVVSKTPPFPTLDPSIFGAIGINEIQAFTLEPVASAIFTKTMDILKAGGGIQDYQILRVTIFPGSGGLLSEITFNVRSTDPAWLADGGTPAADDWINDKCYRFDFVTTETEHQLKNRRTCN